MATSMTSTIVNELFKAFNDENNVPYDFNKSPSKVAKRPHMLDVAIRKNVISVMPDNGFMFEIGNEEAEEKAPHYHILEDSEVIRKPYQGTLRSKGSQDKVMPKSKRDYGGNIINTKGNVVQEYRQNMKRNYRVMQQHQIDKEKQLRQRGKSNYFYNKHYQWIERLLLWKAKEIASLIGAKLVIDYD